MSRDQLSAIIPWVSVCEVDGSGSEELKRKVSPFPAVLRIFNVCDRKPRVEKRNQVTRSSSRKKRTGRSACKTE